MNRWTFIPAIATIAGFVVVSVFAYLALGLTTLPTGDIGDLPWRIVLAGVMGAPFAAGLHQYAEHSLRPLRDPEYVEPDA